MSPNLPHKFQKAVSGRCTVCDLSEYATVHPRPAHEEEVIDLPLVDSDIFHPVEAPAHYCQHKVTTVQLIEDWKLDFFLGNVVKYIERNALKDNALTDLKKARKYLNMKIELLETGKLEKTITHG